VKKCNTCHEDKPDDHYFSAGVKNGKKYFRAKCKVCYNKVKSHLRYRNRDWIVEYKEKLACSKCGYSKKTHKSFATRALQFHHHEGNKTFDVSNGVHRGLSIDTLQKEIDKCVVLCSRCHMEMHS